MRLKPILIFVVLLLSGLLCNEVAALEISEFDDSSLKLSGEIRLEDAETFQNYVSKKNYKRIVLSSGGGIVIAALSIGSIINDKKMETIVAENSTCASACALIWVAGVKRFAGRNSKIGFHAAYSNNDNKLEVSSSANALIGAYLYKLGLSPQTIIYMTEVAPTDMRWLTTMDGNRLGLEFNSDNEIIYPDQSPIYISKDDWRKSIISNPLAKLFAAEEPENFKNFVDSYYQIYLEKDDLKAANYLSESELSKFFYSKLKDASDDIIIEMVNREKRIIKYALKNDLTLCSNNAIDRLQLYNMEEFKISDMFISRLTNSISPRPKIEKIEMQKIFLDKNFTENLNHFVNANRSLAMIVLRKYNNDISKFDYAVDFPNVTDKNELELSCYFKLNFMNFFKDDIQSLVKFMRFLYQNSVYQKGVVKLKE